MRNRWSSPITAAAALAASAAMHVVPALAQIVPVSPGTSVPSPTLKTPWGEPDLQGIWQVLAPAAWDIQDHSPHLGIPAYRPRSGLQVLFRGALAIAVTKGRSPRHEIVASRQADSG